MNLYNSIRLMEALGFASRDEDDGTEESSMLIPALDADFEDGMRGRSDWVTDGLSLAAPDEEPETAGREDDIGTTEVDILRNVSTLMFLMSIYPGSDLPLTV